jgi:hypothetical protein
MEIFLFLIFLSAVYAIRQKKSVFIIALFLLLLIEVLQLLSHLLDIPSLDTLSNIRPFAGLYGHNDPFPFVQGR